MKAQWCDECKYCDLNLLDRLGKGNPCTKGHRPRFYSPKTMKQANTGDFGLKRKCEDFDRRHK